ncbi:hypothetical protein [Bradyrhizobium sp. AT1]|uniref:P-loop ATPase, Sll1717 family n=1 Tax=Bradyrhizobium sp. AT1 TaxID=574934 RepID=UPI0012EE8D0C|nr:hypothetical protein [Bradyrhizobium sp. AT1]
MALEASTLKRAYILLDGMDETPGGAEISLAIEELAERLISASLVVTSRYSPAASRLETRGHFDLFQLLPLTEAEGVDFLRRILPDEAHSATVERLSAQANGNPLALKLIAGLIRERGDVEIPGEVPLAASTSTILDSINRSYQLRFGSDQTGTDARLLLTILAFFQPVSPSDLGRLSGLSVSRVSAASRALLDSSFVTASPTQWTFAHRLISEFHLEKLTRESIDVGALRFGDEAAERDALLQSSFMPPRELNLIESGIKTIVLGDRGAGKSAIFRTLREQSRTEKDVEVVVSAEQSPASFVQQMTTVNASTTSTADAFKAVWLLYVAALGARDIDVGVDAADETASAFQRDARNLLRRIGWSTSIKNEGQLSKWWAVARSFLPDKVTFKIGPVTVEPNLSKGWQNWLGSDMKVDDFINRTDRFLNSTKRRHIILFDQVDEAFKYDREKQEALVQGLFLAESLLSLTASIRLVILLRTDLFELYDIQEKNKFVSRSVRLGWNNIELRKLLLQRLFSNDGLGRAAEALNAPSLSADTLAAMQLRLVFPAEIEGRGFEEWMFDGLKNGKDHVAPRQIILFLISVRDRAARGELLRRPLPLFSESELAEAMTRVSELSYEEVISDFRAATGFVRNCRAGKITEFEPAKLGSLFDEKEGSVVVQIERLERLGFLSRILVKDGDALAPRFRIPRLFTRCWETST